MHILIVKLGALGDVVRTSYFAQPLRAKYGSRLRLSWITAAQAAPLLTFHGAIDDLWTTFQDAEPFAYDRIFSLDDDKEVLRSVSMLSCRCVTGAFVDHEDRSSYTQDAAEWFDMGLLSRYGKQQADLLKRINKRSHAEIFSRIFGVPTADPSFYGDPALESWATKWLGDLRPVIGINPFAGGRWPSKELKEGELRKLIDKLLRGDSALGADCQVMLLGAGTDRKRNLALVDEFRSPRLQAANTDESPLHLAAIIKGLDHLITSDSLAMHLAISQGVRTLAFFAPTSAIEIDGFGMLTKLVSTSEDYCSYRPHADNRSITSERILSALGSSVGQ